jgi:Mor family transcriptional regulator
VVPRDVVRNAKEHATRTVHAKGQVLTKLQRERRDREIRKHARDGRAYQWIGQQYGLSDRQVREIINGKGIAA